MANADALLARAPDLAHAPCEVIASAFKPVGLVQAEVKKGLACGLRVLVQAKPDKIDAVRDFLKVCSPFLASSCGARTLTTGGQGAVPLVEAEPLTPAWYAIEFPGTGVFGIVDFFPSKEGMDAHLQGKVAEALFANVDALLTQAPDVMPLEVLAAKVA